MTYISPVIEQLAPEKQKLVQLHIDLFGKLGSIEGSRYNVRFGLVQPTQWNPTATTPYVTLEERPKTVRGKVVVASTIFPSRMFFNAASAHGLEKKNGHTILFGRLEQLADVYNSYREETERFAKEWNLTPEQLQVFRTLMENHYNQVTKRQKQAWGESKYTFPVYAATIASFDYDFATATRISKSIVPLEEVAAFSGAPTEWIEEWLKN